MSFEEKQQFKKKLSDANKDVIEAADKFAKDPSPENKASLIEKAQIQEALNKEFWKLMGL